MYVIFVSGMVTVRVRLDSPSFHPAKTQFTSVVAEMTTRVPASKTPPPATPPPSAGSACTLSSALLRKFAVYVMFVCGMTTVRTRFVTPSFHCVKTKFTAAVAEMTMFEPAK